LSKASSTKVLATMNQMFFRQLENLAQQYKRVLKSRNKKEHQESTKMIHAQKG
jgi:hypothetical protein